MFSFIFTKKKRRQMNDDVERIWKSNTMARVYLETLVSEGKLDGTEPYIEGFREMFGRIENGCENLYVETMV